MQVLRSDFWHSSIGKLLPKEQYKNCIISGDYVCVELDIEVFKMMQTDEHGGWSDNMSTVSITDGAY